MSNNNNNNNVTSTTTTTIKRDDINSISIYSDDINEIVIGKIIKGRISSINGVSLNELSFNDYVSILKATNINTMNVEIKENINTLSINNKSLQFELLYIEDIIDNESLGISVTYNKCISGNELVGIKIIKIDENGLLSRKLGKKLRVNDTIINVNGVSFNDLSTKLACQLLNNTINRKITILHSLNDDNNNTENEYNHFKDEWTIHKHNYLTNRRNKDNNDMANLAYKYPLNPKFRKSPRIEHQNLLSSYYKYCNLYKT